MAEVTMQENVSISNSGGRGLIVDVFRPAGASGLVPGLLFLPGGGWASANREGLKERYGIPMAQRGYICVTGEYRVMEEAPWPAQIQDVKTILRWMRANSESLGINPAQIVIGGKSAGGQLALLAAGTPGVPEFEGNGANAAIGSEVAAAIGVAPVSDMREWGRQPRLEPLFGANPSTDVLEAASPVMQISASYPPTLLVHGTSDTRVPHTMTMRIYQALADAGVPADLMLLGGQDHGFDGDSQFSNAIADAMALLISRYVAAPATVAAD
ncbi:MAG: alpha/beta hydrolase fold domain-containing protein [Dehalococcoidia bacterium]